MNREWEEKILNLSYFLIFIVFNFLGSIKDATEYEKSYFAWCKLRSHLFLFSHFHPLGGVFSKNYKSVWVVSILVTIRHWQTSVEGCVLSNDRYIMRNLTQNLDILLRSSWVDNCEVYYLQEFWLIEHCQIKIKSMFEGSKFTRQKKILVVPLIFFSSTAFYWSTDWTTSFGSYISCKSTDFEQEKKIWKNWR